VKNLNFGGHQPYELSRRLSQVPSS